MHQKNTLHKNRSREAQCAMAIVHREHQKTVSVVSVPMECELIKAIHYKFDSLVFRGISGYMYYIAN